MSEAKPSRDAKPKWAAVARILRPRGNRGEVAAELLTDFPERLPQIHEVFLGDAAGKSEPRRIAVKSCWLSQNHRGQAVFHFADCDSISEAEKLRGLYVLIPIEQRVELTSRNYFVSDLIGCSVFEVVQEGSAFASSPCSLGSAPALVGAVRDVQLPGEEIAGTPLLVVDTRNGELLVPLAEDICVRVDVVARRIEVRLPEGLRELNRSA